MILQVTADVYKPSELEKHLDNALKLNKLETHFPYCRGANHYAKLIYIYIVNELPATQETADLFCRGYWSAGYILQAHPSCYTYMIQLVHHIVSSRHRK